MPDKTGTSDTQRVLTQKEQKVVDTFEAKRPGLGAIAKRSILNNQVTGWADIIAEMPEEEIK